MSSIKDQIRAEIKRLIGDKTLCSTTERNVGAHTALLKLVSFLDSIPEQPVKGLEEAAEESASQYYVDGGCSPFPNTETAAHKAGFIAGAEWQKVNMMEHAVEGEVVKDINNKLGAVTAKNVNLDKFKFGDKVKILVIKDEGK